MRSSSVVRGAVSGRWLGRVVLAGTLPLVLVACLAGEDTVTGTGGDGDGEPSECAADADCAYRDVDDDACTRVRCLGGRCAEELVKGTAQCQCHGVDDCAYAAKDCRTVTCEAHQCVGQVVPAGPAPEQVAGDCATIVCDGANVNGSKTVDVADVPAGDECGVSKCSASGAVERESVADGTSCGGGGGVCFQGTCVACKPQNPAVCGAEGPGEPANDTSAAPYAMKQSAPFCAMSSSDDVDWYTFYAEDASLSHDVLRFRFWSTAPTIEVCAYFRCHNGAVPEDGCATKKSGPNGSYGCCWSGAPSSLAPTWDVDCPNTGEDSGDVYVSVRAPGGSACEPYVMTGAY